MNGYAMGPLSDNNPGSRLPLTDPIIRLDAPGYAVALDPSGNFCWGRDSIDDDHLVVVLAESVSDRHLAGRRRDGVSYVFGGARTTDVGRVLQSLGTNFSIRRLLIAGGGRINGSLLKAGVVDELSWLVAPAVDGLLGGPAVFTSRLKTGSGRRPASS